MKYQIESMDKSGKGDLISFESTEVSDRLGHHVFLLHNNQKKTRFVHSFTKSRSDFDSGGAKPYRQKGTGRARQGTRRSPLKVGGSVIFGPKPRSVKRKTNKQFFSSNIRQLLLSKLQSSSVFLNSGDVSSVKDVRHLFNSEKVYLFVIDVHSSDDLHLFSRIKNIPNIYFNSSNALIVEDVLRAENIVYSESSFSKCLKQEEVQA